MLTKDSLPTINYPFIKKWGLLLAMLVILVSNIIWAFRNNNLRDFGSFIAAGQLAREGKNPYSDQNPLIFLVSFPSLNLEVVSINLNPPITIVPFDFISEFDPVTCLLKWKFMSLCLYCGSIILALRSIKFNQQIQYYLWALCVGGMWHTIELGQIYIPLVFFISIIINLMTGEKHDWLSGILIGICIAIKPNLGIWLLILLIYKKWTIIFFAIISCVLTSLIPVLLYGAGVYAQWIYAIAQYNGYAIPGNNSILGLFTRIGLPSFVNAANLTLSVFVIFLVWKEKPQIIKASLIALTLTLLVSPIAWPGYITLLIPFILRIQWNKLIFVATIIFGIPAYTIFTYYNNSEVHLLFLGWLYGWGLLLLLFALLIQGDRHEKLPHANQ